MSRFIVECDGEKPPILDPSMIQYDLYYANECHIRWCHKFRYQFWQFVTVSYQYVITLLSTFENNQVGKKRSEPKNITNICLFRGKMCQ